jgi:hypothetical protein
MWALHYLAACGASGLSRDYSVAASKLHAEYLSEPDAGLGSNPLYMIGEVGILLVELILSPSSSAVARLQRAVEASLEKSPDLCFGATGAMVATNFAYRRTNDPAWRAILERCVERLWATWSYSSEAGCHLWTTHLGGCHGFAGNVMALMQVIDLLDPARYDELCRRCVEAYENTAVVEDGCANWWRSVGDPGWGKNKLLVQWCYGAPRRGPGCATGRPAMGMPFSQCTSGPASRSGWTAPECSPCTRFRRSKKRGWPMGMGDSRSGQVILEWPPTYGSASKVPLEFPASTMFDLTER